MSAKNVVFLDGFPNTVYALKLKVKTMNPHCFQDEEEIQEGIQEENLEENLEEKEEIKNLKKEHRENKSESMEETEMYKGRHQFKGRVHVF